MYVVMNRLSLPLLVLLLLATGTSCRQRRPGMSREEAAAELEMQAARTDSLKRQLAGKDTFAADYRPPAGIKYTPNVICAGVKVIDVAAALKNVHQPKPNELGYPDFRPTEVEDMLYPDPLLQVEGRWLLQGVQGLYLLGNDFRLKKTLFRGKVDVKHEGSLSFASPKQVLGVMGYDASARMLRGTYRDFTGEKRGTYIVNLPWDVLSDVSEPWTGDCLTVCLPAKGQGSSPCAIEGGYFRLLSFTSTLYTFGLKGDTLCRFTVNDGGDYTPTSTYRAAEGNHIYLYQGKPRLRMAYDNTVYELTDASTLKAVWQLDFGPLKRPTGRYVTEKLSNPLEGYWFVDGWVETSRYLFLRLAEGHDCPNSRKAGTVKLYTLVHDKQTGHSYSLPPAHDKQGLVAYPEFSFACEGRTFSGYPAGEADGKLYLVDNGKRADGERVAPKGVKEKEVVICFLSDTPVSRKATGTPPPPPPPPSR